MKNTMTISISDKKIKKMIKGNRRGDMIDMGVYNIHKTKTHTSKKVYTRKNKFNRVEY